MKEEHDKEEHANQHFQIFRLL